MFGLNTANRWARKSCPKWNKNRVARRFYRWAYRKLAERYCKTANGKLEIARYQSGASINTYRWPYNDENFANWEEDDSKENYSLISDQSGCVIKYATSYCAYKIFETTGEWPQKTSSERLDAKRWQQFLAESGYTEIVKKPEHNNRYVGIKPDEGEYGLVVWVDYSSHDIIEVSTYINKKFARRLINDPENYIWIKIK